MVPITTWCTFDKIVDGVANSSLHLGLWQFHQDQVFSATEKRTGGTDRPHQSAVTAITHSLSCLQHHNVQRSAKRAPVSCRPSCNVYYQEQQYNELRPACGLCSQYHGHHVLRAYTIKYLKSKDYNVMSTHWQPAHPTTNSSYGDTSFVATNCFDIGHLPREREIRKTDRNLQENRIFWSRCTEVRVERTHAQIRIRIPAWITFPVSYD